MYIYIIYIAVIINLIKKTVLSERSQNQMSIEPSFFHLSDTLKRVTTGIMIKCYTFTTIFL